MAIKKLKDVLKNESITIEQVKALLIAIYCLKEMAVLNGLTKELTILIEVCNEFDKVKDRRKHD